MTSKKSFVFELILLLTSKNISEITDIVEISIKITINENRAIDTNLIFSTILSGISSLFFRTLHLFRLICFER